MKPLSQSDRRACLPGKLCLPTRHITRAPGRSESCGAFLARTLWIAHHALLSGELSIIRLRAVSGSSAAQKIAFEHGEKQMVLPGAVDQQIGAGETLALKTEPFEQAPRAFVVRERRRPRPGAAANRQRHGAAARGRLAHKALTGDRPRPSNSRASRIGRRRAANCRASGRQARRRRPSRKIRKA